MGGRAGCRIDAPTGDHNSGGFHPALCAIMAVEYSISKILGRHQNVEYYTSTRNILEKYSKNTSEVLSGN